MRPQDRTPFAQALEAAATLHNVELSRQLLDLWWKLTQDITLADFHQALETHLRTSRFFPKPAEVISLVEGTGTQRATLAWQTVIEAITRHGSWTSVAFTDPLIVPCVRMLGGWQQLCLTSSQDLHWKETAFVEYYQGLVEHPPFQAGGYLPGAHEAYNQALGQPIQQPIIVGADTEHARLTQSPPSLDGTEDKPNDHTEAHDTGKGKALGKGDLH